MPGGRTIPAPSPPWPRLLIAMTLIPAATQALPADEAKAPPMPATTPATTAPSHEERLPDPDDTWSSSPTPAEHYWRIASYLKGNLAQVRSTIDQHSMEFDNKL